MHTPPAAQQNRRQCVFKVCFEEPPSVCDAESWGDSLIFSRIETMTATATRQLFGTDGIRAVAGESPLDPTTIYAVGLALGHSLQRQTQRREPKPSSSGRDTRESSPWIAATLAAGLRAAGATVESAGIVPTPAVAFLARTHGFKPAWSSPPRTIPGATTASSSSAQTASSCPTR
jgi:hypothetical protein